MPHTKYDNIFASNASAKTGTDLPGSPQAYYDEYSGSLEWTGGELFYHTSINRLYIQINTSGLSPNWRRLTDTFATTTSTSSSTSTSTTSTTSSSTSSSTTTSTSTSTSSSTSTSTSTSSTTTMP